MANEDRIAQRIALAANVSQIGILALAAFGYFYTVRPVYQRDLLEEEVAKATLRLDRTNAELSSAQDELKKTSADLKVARTELAATHSAFSKELLGQRQRTVRLFFGAVAPCLGLMLPPPPLMAPGETPPAAVGPQSAFDIPIGACLRTALATYKSSNHIADEDFHFLSDEIESSIPKLERTQKRFADQDEQVRDKEAADEAASNKRYTTAMAAGQMLSLIHI